MMQILQEVVHTKGAFVVGDMKRVKACAENQLKAQLRSGE